jgi:tetratricopeptide (TPR) repeat protein
VTASPLPLRRKLLYAALLTLVLSAALVAVLEAGLRLSGYGYSPHFARRVTFPDGTGGWRENRWATAPFFSPALVRRPQPFRLPQEKAPHTYRIFILGSSAAMGDPEPSFSLARTLEKLLSAAYPEIRFEVVNAAVTAINSHLVRGIAADCAALQPDLFIVYEGNNEVIGPFGPSGVFTPFLRSEAAIRAAVWAKGTRLGQLVSAAGRRLTGAKEAPADWGGMQMFLRQSIAADDPRLAAVRAHLRSNLVAIARSAEQAGARSIVCTVVTNERDFAPFLSVHRPGLAADELARWQSAYTAAEAAQRAGDLAQAEQSHRAALAIDDRYAELPFRLGRLRLQRGDDVEAQTLLRRARDLDALRFRTDAQLNAAIREVAAAGIGGCEVLDLAARLAAQSAHGLPGDDLLYEHVHLTLHGTFAAASALYERVSANLAARRLTAAPRPLPFGYDEARLRLGYTMHEQAMIALELVNRFRAPPFTGQADQGFRLQTWQRRAEMADALLARPDALPALRQLYREALQRSPDDWILARNAGAMFVTRQAPAEAVPLLEQARRWIDDDVDTLVPLGWAYRATHRTAEADAVFAKARALEPRYPGLPKQP